MNIVKFRFKNRTKEQEARIRKEDENYHQLLEAQIQHWQWQGKLEGALVIFNAAAFAVLIPLILSKLMNY